jgi:hypothetical protein
MKVRITSKTYYVAETKDGKKYSVDINNPIIKNAYNNNQEIEGIIEGKEIQDRYTNGEYARSYSIIETFIPKKEKITLPKVESVIETDKIKKKPVLQHIGLPKKN